MSPEQSMPLVSIIITSYNYGRFLSYAIDNALNQTYQNTEVIVVDDGSEDNSREIISSYAGRIIPVLKENEGQASAFNAGFAVSKGDIIIFLDSDDKLAPNVAEEIVKVWHPGISKMHYRLQWIDAQGNLLNVYGPPAGTLLHKDIILHPLQTATHSGANFYKPLCRSRRKSGTCILMLICIFICRCMEILQQSGNVSGITGCMAQIHLLPRDPNRIKTGLLEKYF
jgi:glycosyltransferase involved in cell wall biosynthesis